MLVDWVAVEDACDESFGDQAMEPDFVRINNERSEVGL